MPLQSLKFRARAFAAAASAAAFLFVASAADSQKANPFTKFGGNWIGNGLIYLSNGNEGEDSLPRADSSPRICSISVSLKLDLRCAGDSYNFELHSDHKLRQRRDIRHVEREYPRRQRQDHGQDQRRPDSGHAESQTFTARLELITWAKSSTVRITSPGSEIVGRLDRPQPQLEVAAAFRNLS